MRRIRPRPRRRPPSPTTRGEAAAAAADAGAEAPAAAGAAAGEETPPGVRRIESAPKEPVDLVGAAGVPVAKRVAPAVAILAVLWLLRVLLRRRKR